MAIKEKGIEMEQAVERGAKFEKMMKEQKVNVKQRDNRIGVLAKKIEELVSQNKKLEVQLKKAMKEGGKENSDKR